MPGDLSSFAFVSGTLSLDRVTLLVYSPFLSVYVKDESAKHRLDKIDKFNSLFQSMCESHCITLDPDFPQGCRSDLYLHHYRVLTSTDEPLDIQFGATSPVRKRITDQQYLDAFGSSEDKENGYIDEYIPSRYGFRLEFNPNFSSPGILKPILSGLCRSTDYPDFIRISRLDIAIDYPYNICPELVSCSRMRKGFLAYGSQGLETVYFGSRHSTFMFRIYDKKKQLLEEKSISIPEQFLWRVELESKEAFSLLDLPLEKLGSVFDRLSFYYGGQSTGDWALDLILKNSMNYGLDCTLSSLPKATKFRYKKLISDLVSMNNIEAPGQIFKASFLAKFNNLRNDILRSFGLQEML